MISPALRHNHYNTTITAQPLLHIHYNIPDIVHYSKTIKAQPSYCNIAIMANNHYHIVIVAQLFAQLLQHNHHCTAITTQLLQQSHCSTTITAQLLLYSQTIKERPLHHTAFILQHSHYCTVTVASITDSHYSKTIISHPFIAYITSITAYALQHGCQQHTVTITVGTVTKPLWCNHYSTLQPIQHCHCNKTITTFLRIAMLTEPTTLQHYLYECYQRHLQTSQTQNS